VPKSASSSAVVYHELLERIGAGQSAESVARQLGRTPQTIRDWIAAIDVRPAGPPPRRTLSQRMYAWRHELLCSLLSLSESRYAAQTSRELLKLYWIVAASHPALGRRDTYRKVVMARTGADHEQAETLLRQAEQSFATWPTDRPLTFSDVVHYLAVSEYLAIGDKMGTRTDMGRLVAGRIPANL